MRKIYNLGAEPGLKDDFVITRNREIGKLLAKVINCEYAGDLAINHHEPGDTDIVIPDDPIMSGTAAKLGITKPQQIYGSVVSNKFLASKSIFHLPVPDAEYVPYDFPYALANDINALGLTTPGYTAFTKKDIYKACERLNREGYLPRLKDTRASFGTGQKFISSESELNHALENLSEQTIKEYGYVVEAQIITSHTFPHSFSGGWSTVGDYQYSYVGVQNVNVDNYGYPYKGTEIMAFRGDINSVSESLPPHLVELLRQIKTLTSVFTNTPGLICSRYNFDFIAGELITQKGVTRTGIFLTEQSFRIGAATAAEFLALKNMTENPNLKKISTSTTISYNDPRLQPSNAATILYDQVDKKLGPVKVWVEAIDRLKTIA